MSRQVPDHSDIAAEGEFRALFEWSGICMARLDHRARIVAANAELARQAGLRPEQMSGQPFEAMLHSGSRQRFHRCWDALASGAANYFSQRLIMRTVAPFSADVTAVAARHPTGQIASAAIIVDREPQPTGADPRVRITPVDARVLEGVAGGASTAELAVRLYLSKQGIDYHIAKLMRAFDAANRVALVARAYEWDVLTEGWPPKVARDAIR